MAQEKNCRGNLPSFHIFHHLIGRQEKEQVGKKLQQIALALLSLVWNSALTLGLLRLLISGEIPFGSQQTVLCLHRLSCCSPLKSDCIFLKLCQTTAGSNSRCPRCWTLRPHARDSLLIDVVGGSVRQTGGCDVCLTELSIFSSFHSFSSCQGLTKSDIFTGSSVESRKERNFQL